MVRRDTVNGGIATERIYFWFRGLGRDGTIDRVDWIHRQLTDKIPTLDAFIPDYFYPSDV